MAVKVSLGYSLMGPALMGWELMPPLLTLNGSADSETVGYCHLGEGTLGSHIVSRGQQLGTCTLGGHPTSSFLRAT